MSTQGENDVALTDVTNTMAAAQIQGNSAAVDRVRNAQWTGRQKFDYETYNADTREKRAALPAADVPTWAANAVKYEWSDEYGDIGPEFKELEDALFGDDTKTRKGDRYRG